MILKSTSEEAIESLRKERDGLFKQNQEYRLKLSNELEKVFELTTALKEALAFQDHIRGMSFNREDNEMRHKLRKVINEALIRARVKLPT